MTFVVPEHMHWHPTIQRKIHKVHKLHKLQVYDLVANAPIANLAYKVYIWEGYCST